MERIEKAIEVDVPVRVAYNQWTQFEEFPHFMEGVEKVTQLDDKHLHWEANVGGKSLEWDSEITEQIPDKRIAWYSQGDVMHSGMVEFEPLGPNRTRVRVRMQYEPEGLTQEIGDKLGILSRRVEKDLQRFKEFIESRGQETGAWRGMI
jgi:uncharacterized membrane protein